MKKTIAVALLCLILPTFSACSNIDKMRKKEIPEYEPAFQMFQSGNDDVNVGELHFKKVDGDSENIAQTAKKEEYLAGEKTGAMLVLNSNDELYLKDEKGAKSKIADNVLPSSYSISDNEDTIAFLVKNQESADLYICKIGDDKEKISGGFSKYAGKESYSISSDGAKILFKLDDNSLYQWEAGGDKEKIASDISSFCTYNDNSAYSYSNENGSYYVKFSNDNQTQKMGESIGGLSLTSNGLMAVFIGAFNSEKNYGELYIAIKGSDSIKIASDVTGFSVTDENDIYFVNNDNGLYFKDIPKVSKDTCKNISKFLNKVTNTEKIKLGEDVTNYEVSPNGKNIGFIDNEKNMYVCINNKEKAKFATDVSNFRMFDERLLYVNINNQIFLNSVIKDIKNIGENNKMIAQLASRYVTSTNGRYITFVTSDKSDVFVCTDGGAPKVAISDFDSYDLIICENQVLYEKRLAVSDVVGNYKNPSLGVAYKITADGHFIMYEKGVECENSILSFNGLNKVSAEMSSDNSSSAINGAIFYIESDGTKYISYPDVQFTLEQIDDNGLNEEIVRQYQLEVQLREEAARKAAEEAQREAKRIAAEKAAAALKLKKEKATKRANSYLNNGVYVSCYQTLYYSPNYSSASGITYNYSGYKNVYDYKISSDGNTIWLKLYVTGSGYSYYVWVSES